ncbi:hypothetical protein WJX77_007049 [Trebouxia sp. C0004]
MQNVETEDLQAEPVPEAKEAIQSILVGEAPLTDLPPESLVDTETPLESQPDVQNTLEMQQQHSAVYSPGVNEAPEQTPDQIAAVSSTALQSKAPGQDQWLSKHSKRDRQQEGLAKASDREGARSKGSFEGGEGPEPQHKFDGNFTFTAAPNVPMAKKLQRKNFSHSEARLREIKRENKMMVDRLAHAAPSQPQTPLPPAPAASAGVNRRRAADNINEENFAIFRRLQAVQPSKEIRREHLEHDFRINQQYVQNASHFRAQPTATHVESLQP